VLLDRRRVKFWQKWIFGIMAVLMAGFLIMIPVSNGVGCGGQSGAATDQADKEIVAARAATQAQPKDAAAWRSLGEAYLARGNQRVQDTAGQEADWRQAAASYERAVKLLGKQKGAEAKRLRVDSLEQLVSVYLFLKDYELATSAYGQLTELRPNNAQYFFDMATVAISAGDNETALLAFRKFLQLEPSSPDAPAVRDWIQANTPKSKTASPSPTKGTGQ
jgi:tetratricopeptide (TPR) repeat protein